MIIVHLISESKELKLSPLKSDIPEPGLNQNLQHQEEEASCSIECTPETLDFFMKSKNIKAEMLQGKEILFTGAVSSELSWTDEGMPTPITSISFSIKDNTYLLDMPIGTEYSGKSLPLGNIVKDMCSICGVQLSKDALIPTDIIPVITIQKGKVILQVLNNILFQYGYAFIFNGNGELSIFSLTPEEPTETIAGDKILATFKGKKSKKEFDYIQIKYGNLIKKENEQVYFEGNGLDAEYNIVPITIRPGQYYPYASDPIQEEREGQVFQKFESGFAESYKKYSGETAYRRNNKANLIYTENQYLVQDWSGAIDINRTDFKSLEASVRLQNKGSTDAQLMQLAIRADAWYRTDAVFIRGTGKKEYTYEAEFIYEESSAEKLSSLLSQFFLGGNYTFTLESELKLKPGTTIKVNTGASSLDANCYILNTKFDADRGVYTSTLITFGDVVLDVKKYKEQTTLPSIERQTVAIVEKSTKARIPGNVENLEVKAEKDGLRFFYSLANVEYFSRLTVELKKKTEWMPVNLEGNLYKFNRKKDGFPEAEEMIDWKVRVKVLNIYGNNSVDWVESYINTDNYGTWKLTAPEVNTRVSNRTLTLMFSQTPRADNKAIYGDIKYGVQIQRPDIDKEFYTPNESANPELSEDNYKVPGESKYVYRSEIYVQTMPLIGQASNNIIDTLYRFKVIAKNEAGLSETVEINATAICTSIKDIVKANQTAKEQYVEKLSAISANLGEVSGSLNGNNYNYWTLADMFGALHKQGAFRVGDSAQGLIIIPPHDSADGYTNNTDQVQMILKAGVFELTSTDSKINGELIVQENPDTLDRTRITPVGTFFEHRESINGNWEIIASNTSNGIRTKQVYSEGTLLVSNQDMTTRRLEGTDIGNEYLSAASRVIHFDENLLDQLGNDVLSVDGKWSLRGSEDTGSLDFTPAILTVSPYSTIGKSIYGQFTAALGMSVCTKFTVDFWIQYIYAENQVIFDIGNTGDRIRLIIQAREPFLNDINTPSSTPDDNFFLTKEQGDSLLFTKIEADEMPLTEPAEGEPPLTRPGEKEPRLIRTTQRMWQPSFEFFEKENGIFKQVPVTAYEYDDKIASGLYEQDCVLFQPAEAQNYIEHTGQTSSEEVQLTELGISFKENSWLHVGIIAQDMQFCVYLNDKQCCFDRFATTPDKASIILNSGKQSFLLDELYFDNTVAETFETFVQHTKNRIPWGALTKDNDYFMLMAKDTTKVITNLFETPIFKQVMINIFESESFKNKIKEIIANKE